MREYYILKDVYERMMDDESVTVFENRILYSYTGDYKYINRITENFEERKIIESRSLLIKSQVLFEEGFKQPTRTQQKDHCKTAV